MALSLKSLTLSPRVPLWVCQSQVMHRSGTDRTGDEVIQSLAKLNADLQRHTPEPWLGAAAQLWQLWQLFALTSGHLDVAFIGDRWEIVITEWYDLKQLCEDLNTDISVSVDTCISPISTCYRWDIFSLLIVVGQNVRKATSSMLLKQRIIVKNSSISTYCVGKWTTVT